MHLALVCEFDFHLHHIGVRSLILTIARAMEKAGHRVSFLINRGDDNQAQWLLAFPNRELCDVNFIEGCEFITGSSEDVAALFADESFDIDLDAFPKLNPISYLTLGDKIPDSMFDMAVLTVPWLRGLTGRLPIRTVVGIVHDTVPNTYALNARNMDEFSYKHSIGFKYYTEHCDAVWANSHFTAEAFAGFCEASGLVPPEITVLPPVQSLQMSQIESQVTFPRERMVLAVGLFDWRKGLADAPRILSGVCKDAHLVICSGIRCERAAVSAFFHKISAPKVSWYKSVRPAKLAEFYGKAKVLLFNSDAEGLGLPVVEAQAAGCRVLSSDQPALLEILLSGSKAISRDNVAAFSESLEAMVEEEFDHEAFAREARAAFSPDHLVRHMQQYGNTAALATTGTDSATF